MVVIQQLQKNKVVLIDDATVRYFVLHECKVYEVGNKNNSTSTPQPGTHVPIGWALLPAGDDNRQLDTVEAQLLATIRRHRKHFMDLQRRKAEKSKGKKVGT